MSASGRQALEQDLADERVRDAAHDLLIAGTRMRDAAPKLLAVLLQCEEYFDNCADVHGVPRPNREMQILTEIREALARAGLS